MARRPFQANARSDQRDNLFKFDLSKDAAFSRDLGAGQDVAEVKSPATVTQIRLSFTSAEVGNGKASDAGTLANQDGGLAVRLQAENGGGVPSGTVYRFDDEGITFTTKGDAKFDVRDLVSGAARGDMFDVVILGTSGADTFDETGSSEAYYINGGMGDDMLTGGLANDFLVGGAGNDRLNGQGGNDSFIGGAGADVFVFTGTAGNDRIIDFVANTDKIDFTAYGITVDNVMVTQVGADTLVAVDTNFDGMADFQLTLAGIAPPPAADYLF